MKMKKIMLPLLLGTLPFFVCGGTVDFEQPSKDYKICAYVKNRYVTKAPGLKFERSALKAQSGKYSLEMIGDNPNRTFHYIQEIERPAAPGGVQLDFSYFIAEGEGKLSVSGRIIQKDAKGKSIKPYKFFTSPVQKGEWLKSGTVVYPKPECRKLQATIWFKGKMRVYLDDVKFDHLAEEKAAQGKAEILGEGAFGTWFAAPADRKIARTGISGKKVKTSVLRMKGAKGEKTAVILAVAPKKNYKRLELEISDPAGVKKLFSVNTLGFIEMRNPDNPTMKGFHSDPLLPEAFAPGAPGVNSCFYVEAAIPRTGVSGVLKGTMKLKGDGVILASVPYELRVRNFSLPKFPILKTYMPVRAHKGFRKFDKRRPVEISDDMLQLCANERINPQGGVEITSPVMEIRNGLPVVTDWTPFDKCMDKLAVRYGFDRVRLSLPTLGANGGWFDKRGPHFMGEHLLKGKGLKYLGEVTRLYYERLKKKYPHVTGYAYFYDEPPAWLHQDVQKIFSTVMKAAPECKIFLTGGYGLKFLDTAYVFCMPLAPGHVWSEADRQRVTKGEIWYYNWNAPLDNSSYHINRLFPWLCYTANGIGALAWHSNHTGSLTNPCNPWTDMELTYECGKVALFYPPRTSGEKICASIRLRHRGESLEDYDYIKLLEKSIDKHFPGKGRARLLEIMKEVIPEPPFKFRNDPDAITFVRDRIGDEIESFSVQPVVLLQSNPAENSESVLPEVNFVLNAAPGTVITVPGGKKYTAGKEGKAAFKLALSKLGKSTLYFTVEKNGKKKTLFRQYTLLADPLLKEFKTVAETGADKELVRKCETSVYTGQMREAVSKRLMEIKNSRLKHALAEAKKSSSPLSKALTAQAEKCLAWALPERAAYYIALARTAAKGAVGGKVRITPFVQDKHFGVQLDNGIVSARFLETGGRMISFKIRGVEIFARPEWKKVLPPRDRAMKLMPEDLRNRMPEYGGLEDASGRNYRWPVSAVDWDMEIVEQSANRVIVAFSAMIPGTPFLLRRAATLNANATEIQFDYNIRNTAPRDLQSDDPESFQLPWRLRLLPGIGKDGAGHDTLGIPSAKKAPRTTMNTGAPSFYSERFLLTKPAAGAFDSREQTGFILCSSPEIMRFGYVWFDDRSRNTQKQPLYTLEVLRSFFRRQLGETKDNMPLVIMPGKELGFRVYLKGFSGKDAEKQWRTALEK